MRDLTEIERATIRQRQNTLDALIEDCIVALLDLATQLGISTPAYFVRTPKLYIDVVDRHYSESVFNPDERIRAIFVIGGFIAELFSRNLGGCWLVDDDSDSQCFCQYVVGEFSSLGNTTFRISPFALAKYYVDLAPVRSLKDVIARAESDLMAR